MISMNNRRNLFQGVFSLVVNANPAPTESDRKVIPFTVKKSFVIGRLKDYPLGEKKLIVSRQIFVETLPEGIRIQSSNNPEQFFSVALNSQGELVVNKNEVWNADIVFSMMTNEPVRLNNN
jgi:hypothetical protein